MHYRNCSFDTGVGTNLSIPGSLQRNIRTRKCSMRIVARAVPDVSKHIGDLDDMMKRLQASQSNSKPAWNNTEAESIWQSTIDAKENIMHAVRDRVDDYGFSRSFDSSFGNIDKLFSEFSRNEPLPPHWGSAAIISLFNACIAWAQDVAFDMSHYILLEFERVVSTLNEIQ